MVSSVKLHILKKGEYILWTIKMEQYLAHTDYALWEVILNGNNAVQMTKDKADEHLARFYGIKDAKTLWAAIKTRFGGNVESKKMQKNVLKQQFENFSVSNSDCLDKGYDIFQRLLSLLEIHGAGVSTEDANKKFLGSLPSAWSNISSIMKNKPGIDNLDIDDLYNNLKVYEADIKGSSGSSSNSQNVAFISAESTSSTNELNTAYSVSTATGHSSQAQDDLEEMNLKWQVAMLSIRVKRFYKKTRRKLELNGKEQVGFDNTKVECFDCHRIKHFARDCRSARNSGNKSRDAGNAWYKGRDNGKRSAKKEDEKALVVQDGLEEEVTETVFDNRSSDEENSLANDSVFRPEPIPAKIDFVKAGESVKHVKPIKSVKHVKHVKPVKTAKQTEKSKKFSSSPKVDRKDWNRKMTQKLGLGFGFTKKACFVCGSMSHLIKDCTFYEDRMAKKSVLPTNVGKGTGHRESIPVWNNVQRINHQNKFAPTTVFTRSGRIPVSAAKPKAVASTSAAKPVNTAGPKQSVNFSKSRSNCYRSYSPIRRSFYNATTHSRRNSTKRVNTAGSKAVSDVKTSAGNKAYLVDYQEIKNGGFVAFGSGRGKITSKVKIRTENLDFDDVYFVNELKFNLFSVSQKCDKKNSVLFTKTECLVLSPNFKLLDESQVLLRVPKQSNMYSFDLQNVVPYGDLTYLFTKASIDKSNLWHMRLGHVNFKTMNKLVTRNLGKADEGFLVGYSVTSKAFRVFNTKTRKVKESLHVRFLENKPNVAGTSSNWLFDIDSLTNSMNYIPVSARNQTDKNTGPQETTGNAGTQDNVDARKEVSDQHYIVLPLWSSISFTFKSSDDKAEDNKTKDDTGSKTLKEPVNKEDQTYRDELDSLMSQEKEASDVADSFRKESEQGCMDQREATKAGSTNPVNNVSNLVNAASTVTPIFVKKTLCHNLGVSSKHS
uniref:CCHC-type domain-containing protein n=1 Tax=Tanacetum cinerariifolium TaxID=118510 RepID=A0A699H7A2_TANCI|nr:hypothetical protein [Tanacetum cinerariifolium]